MFLRIGASRRFRKSRVCFKSPREEFRGKMFFEAAVDSSLEHDMELAEALNETPPPREEVAQRLRDFAANYKGSNWKVREWFSGRDLYRMDETDMDSIERLRSGAWKEESQQELDAGEITEAIMKDMIDTYDARLQAFDSGKLVYDRTFI